MSGLRDGQVRVEVRPGAFIWMSPEDKKFFEANPARAAQPAKESAAVAAPENTAEPMPAARKPVGKK